METCIEVKTIPNKNSLCCLSLVTWFHFAFLKPTCLVTCMSWNKPAVQSEFLLHLSAHGGNESLSPTIHFVPGPKGFLSVKVYFVATMWHVTCDTWNDITTTQYCQVMRAPLGKFHFSKKTVISGKHLPKILHISQKNDKK